MRFPKSINVSIKCYEWSQGVDGNWVELLYLVTNGEGTSTLRGPTAICVELGHIECTLFKSLDFVNLWLLGHMLQSSWGSLGEVRTVNGVGTQETQCSQHEEPILICLGKTGTMESTVHNMSSCPWGMDYFIVLIAMNTWEILDDSKQRTKHCKDLLCAWRQTPTWSNFIHSLIHSFSPSIFTEHKICARGPQRSQKLVRNTTLKHYM